jgi:peptidoglycan/xylan/chitin deacetylase (PgdA/CDA1 family)
MRSPGIFRSVTFRIYITLVFSIFLFVVLAVPLTVTTSAENNNNNNDNDNDNDDIINKSGTRLVIINFDDSYDSQIDYAKPILDKYGFKATFFEICGRITESGWEEIERLQDDGMDIQAHTMAHSDLNEISDEMLDIELHKARDCFLEHGLNTTVFAYPYGNGWNNETVLDVITRYYDLARTNGYDALTFLNCDRWNGINYTIMANDSYNSRSSCVREEGEHQVGSKINSNRASNLQQTLGSSRYALNSWSHKHIEGPYDYSNLSCIDTCKEYDNSQMLDRFIEIVNSQSNFNNDGTVRAIPIIVYHAFVPYDDVSESRIPTDINVNLFQQEMKYLHENGFKTLTMKDLRYDEKRDTLVIRNNDQ